MSGGARFGRPVLRAAPFVVLAVAGCSSPEADRVRGGGAGADPGNRGAIVRMHDGSDMYHDVPCETTIECQGPAPVFGLPEFETDSSD